MAIQRAYRSRRAQQDQDADSDIPESTHATESWNAAFRAHSCSGKNEDAVSGGNGEHGWNGTPIFHTEFNVRGVRFLGLPIRHGG